MERYKLWAENKLAMAVNTSGCVQGGQSLARLCQGRSELRKAVSQETAARMSAVFSGESGLGSHPAQATPEQPLHTQRLWDTRLKEISRCQNKNP